MTNEPSQIAPNSQITPASQLTLDPVPDYAIDALWIEWERARRKKPPANMICTTGKSYQEFCRQVKDYRSKYPALIIERQTLFSVARGFSMGYSREQVAEVKRILDKWDESDTNAYVAFIYEGRQYRDVIEAAIAQLHSGSRLFYEGKDGNQY